MADITTKTQRVKPEKPRPDFPLFPHQTGRWAKKVKGKMFYFGPWEDPDGALNRWLDQKDDLFAGRMPRAKQEVGVTVRDVVNAFMTAKADAHKAGELSAVLYSKYYDTCERIIRQFGERRPLSDLRPSDFGAFRAIMAAKWPSPITLGCEIQRIRTVFKFGFDNELIPAPVKFGSLFKKPSRAVLRVHKSKQPRKLFAPEEIRALLGAADEQMRAMILLGINCGWGNQDIAGLRTAHLDLKNGVAAYPRAKTGVDRRSPLWVETVKALKKVLASRPKAQVPADGELVFRTKFGNPWRVSSANVDMEADRKIRWHNVDSVGLEFGKLLRQVKIGGAAIKRVGLNFYSLRHTFKTVAERAGDMPAVDRVMGHEDPDDIGTHYREWTGAAEDDARLRRVTEHVRKWLFGKATAAKGKV